MSSFVPSMGQTVLALAGVGSLWAALWWLAFALFSALEAAWGRPLAACAAAAACLALVAVAVYFLRQPAPRQGSGDPELDVIAGLAVRRPFLGVALSAVLGAVRALESPRR